MVYEYAIDPNLFVLWGSPKDHRYYLKQLGIGTPRLLAGFPSKAKWIEGVKALVNEVKNDMEKARLIELFAVVKRRMIIRDNPKWDSSLNWHSNLAQEHQIPFHAIMSVENPCSLQRVLIETDTVTINPSDPLWDLPQQLPGGRKSEEIAKIMHPMLFNCRQVVLVDPYFRPWQQGYRTLFEEFLFSVFSKIRKPPMERIEIQCVEDPETVASDFYSKCMANLRNLVPPGQKVVVRVIRKFASDGDDVHNRYVLTDIGGISFGKSIQGQSQEGSTDDIVLLSRDLYDKRWDQYAGPVPVFLSVGEPLVING